MATERKKVTDYLKLPYHRVLVPAEEGGYFGEITEFPGCFAEGESVEETYRNLEEIAADWIEGTLRDGERIPEPAIDHTYSGKFALRVPRDLHRMAAVKAARDGVSLNTCFVTAIAAWVGADNLYERLVRRAEESLVPHNLFNVLVVTGPTANISGSNIATIRTADSRDFIIGISDPKRIMATAGY